MCSFPPHSVQCVEHIDFFVAQIEFVIGYHRDGLQWGSYRLVVGVTFTISDLGIVDPRGQLFLQSLQRRRPVMIVHYVHHHLDFGELRGPRSPVATGCAVLCRAVVHSGGLSVA